MRRGFTWVELLVILTVVFLAVLLLMPVFFHVREASARARCLSHLRSLSNAISIYSAANNNTLPLSMPAADGRWQPKREATPDDVEYWANSISADAIDFTCPVTDAPVAYAYNGYMHGLPNDKIRSNKSAIAIWEGFGKQPRNVSLPRLDCGQTSEPCSFFTEGLGTVAEVPSGTSWTHGRGANFLYLDGHAEWRRLGERAGRPTDARIDPFHQYDKSGRVDRMWLDEEGRAPLFRP